MKTPHIIRKSLLLGAIITATVGSSEAKEVIEGKCRSENHIVVFAKYFDIEGSSQIPKGDTGRFIVLKRGQRYKGWRLDPDPGGWRWLCGNKRLNWVGPTSETIGNLTQIPGAKELITGIFGNWERDRSGGAKSIDIHFKRDGNIIFTAHH